MIYRVKEEAVSAFGPGKIMPGNLIDLPQAVGDPLVKYHILEWIEEEEDDRSILLRCS